MPNNNMAIMVGLGLAGLWFMNRQRGSQEDQVGQLTGAAMQSSGEGTWPASLGGGLGELYSVMAGTNVPLDASTDEDIGVYPGGGNRPELEFTVAKSIPPAGTSDPSPTTPAFAGTAPLSVTASTIWDQEALIASANFMPLLAIQDVQGISILQSDVDIATLTSTDKFRAINVGTGDVFTTTGGVLAKYTRGWQGARAADPVAPVVQQTWQQIEAASGLTARQTSAPWLARQEWDLDIGI
jgi:hypothetical protein